MDTIASIFFLIGMGFAAASAGIPRMFLVSLLFLVAGYVTMLFTDFNKYQLTAIMAVSLFAAWGICNPSILKGVAIQNDEDDKGDKESK